MARKPSDALLFGTSTAVGELPNVARIGEGALASVMKFPTTNEEPSLPTETPSAYTAPYRPIIVMFQTGAPVPSICGRGRAAVVSHLSVSAVPAGPGGRQGRTKVALTADRLL